MVDPKSYETAEYFLADFKPVPEVKTMELAQVIQDAIEDWIGDGERSGLLVEAPDPITQREGRDD